MGEGQGTRKEQECWKEFGKDRDYDVQVAILCRLAKSWGQEFVSRGPQIRQGPQGSSLHAATGWYGG